MRNFVSAHRIPDVILAGFLNQSEISQAYEAADVFALASGWDETWGLVVNEAMNFGLPVVVSDKVGCAVDLVAHGENGYVFPNDRPDELAQYLTSLITDPTRRESFGRRSAEIIAPWNDDVAAQTLLEAVRAAVGERKWAAAEDCARGIRTAELVRAENR
jgi:glycosyltransferase involved in cell wall biosynthesis